MYKFDHLIVGAGIIGSSTINNIIEEIKKKHFKKKTFIKLGIIDQNLENFPGGIAYSLNKSLYGYFNNPIRLSNIKFIKWIKIKKNKKKIINYLDRYGGLSGKKWVVKNRDILFGKNTNEFMELYLPRFSYELWLQDAFLRTVKKIKSLKKKNILI